MDSTLETLRLRLTDDLKLLLRLSAGRIYSKNLESRTLAVPDEWFDPEHPRHKDSWPTVHRLNAAARKTYESYELLIQKGRSVLRVP